MIPVTDRNRIKDFSGNLNLRFSFLCENNLKRIENLHFSSGLPFSHHQEVHFTPTLGVGNLIFF